MQAAGLEDETLAPGTRLRVAGHEGTGTYERFERRTFGANSHWVRWGEGPAEEVGLKKLAPTDWAVLPPETETEPTPEPVRTTPSRPLRHSGGSVVVAADNKAGLLLTGE